MSKLPTVSLIFSGFGSTEKINSNFTAITNQFSNCLSLDGSSPNALAANLDLNSNRIINLADPTNSSDAATKAYVDTHSGGGGGSGGTGDMLKSDNLSGLANYTTARSNLGLGGLAVLGNVSTLLAQGSGISLATVGSVTTITATGSGTGDMLKSDNLSGLSNYTTARSNLGLGTSATTAASSYLAVANNLSDVTASTARTNLGLGSLAVLSDVSTKITAGTNVTITGPVAGVMTINASLAGGTVSSAAGSSTNLELVLFSGTGGSTITNSSCVPSANGLTLLAHTFSQMRTDLGLGTSATVNTGTSGATIPLLNGANTWSTTQTFTVAPVFSDASGSRTALGLGTSATFASSSFLQTANNLSDVTASTARTNLGLGTAATQATGTSGATLPFLNGTNTWASAQTFTTAPVFTDQSGSRTSLGLGTAATSASTAFEPAGAYAATNAQTGTTYTLVLGDQGKMVTMNNASSNTLTVPLNSSVAFPTLARLDLVQLGAGQTTIAAAGGVTINSSGSKLKLTGQYSGASLIKTATDTWLLIGDIST